MTRFNKDFKEFLNEAYVYEMHVGDYVKCDGNFTKITPVKGLYAKIIGSGYKPHPNNRWKRVNYYTLKFDTILTDRRGENPVETDTIEITVNQIRNLRVIKRDDYYRIQSGYTAQYNASPIFQAILRYIKFYPIHQYLDASYFDVDDKGIVSLLPSNKIEMIREPERYTTTQRQPTKITRILAKLNDKLTSQQIADFGNKFTAWWKELNVNIVDRINVVTGDLITYWYNEKNYVKPQYGGGSLNSSCMRYEHTQGRVAFYAKHPDKVALCILLDETKTKLLARALVWRLDQPKDVIFMDRIYYVTQEHEAIMANYAQKMGWQTKLSGYNNGRKLVVNIKVLLNEPVPYLDTLKTITSTDLRQF